MIRGVLAPLLLAVLLVAPARDEEPGDIHAVYQAYAAGLHVASVEAGFGFGPWSYQVRLAYHTVGLAGVFFDGHQLNTVTGSWTDQHSTPHRVLRRRHLAWAASQHPDRLPPGPAADPQPGAAERGRTRRPYRRTSRPTRSTPSAPWPS